MGSNLIGRQFGDYQLLRRLGGSGFADVLKAASKPGQIHNALTIVGVDERGHQYSYNSINAAINDVPPNWLIFVPPGIYHESIILNKPVEIIGDGPRDQIIIESSDADCIQMQTSVATIRHLTLRCSASRKHKKFYAVDVPQGQLKLTACDITSDSLSCIGIHNSSANPVIQQCIIHDGKQSGIYVYENGQGIIEDCDIFGNAYAGAEIREGGNPYIMRCRINRNGYEAVRAYDRGSGVIEDCDLTGNKHGAWNVSADSNVRQSGNKT